VFFPYYFLELKFVVQSSQRKHHVPTADELVTSLLRNRSTLLRYAFVGPLVAGILCCGIGYFMGRTHLRLILKGARAQGTVVDFQAKSFNTSGSGGGTSIRTGYMPVVEYRAFGDQTVRFEDWLGSTRPGKRNHRSEIVQVLYDPTKPSVAMIDRPIWNWVPWAPVVVVGVLLIMSGIRRAWQSLFGTPSSC